MAVLYKSFQSVLEDKNHKKMFHPRVIYTANISTSQIAKEIAAYSSLSPGDVKNTLDNLVTVMGQHLQASESVSLDGFGTFRMVMKRYCRWMSAEVRMLYCRKSPASNKPYSTDRLMIRFTSSSSVL